MTKTVRIGQKAHFDPYKEREIGKPEETVTVTGTVVFINEPHRWFGVTYGPGLRTSFLFCQVGKDVWVDFNQGLDARLITPEIAKLLAGLHWIRFVRLSCDTSAMLPVIERAAAYLQEAGVAKSRLWAYALVQDVEEAHRRVLALDKMGVTPFAHVCELERPG